MIRFSAQDRVDAVDLFEQNNEGEFVLQGEPAQGDDMIGAAPQLGGMPVGAADENGDPFHRIHLPALDPAHKISGGPGLAALVENDAHRPLARGEQGLAVFDLAGVFPVGLQLEGGVAGETLLIFLDSPLGVAERRFPDGEDLPLHAINFLIAPTCNGRGSNARWPFLIDSPTVNAPLSTDYLDRFSGLARLYGAAALPKLHRAHVAVIGIGGVGSWTAEALARSGVGELTLIDLDEICVTNINRQLPALAGHIGRLKVSAMAERLRLINPELAVHEEIAFFTEATAERLLSRSYDCVVDGIDDARLKALLIASCRDRSLPLIVSGGAGGKSNPAAVRVADLAGASNDKLLRLVRKELRRHYGYPPEATREPFQVRTVYSEENARFPWADGSVRRDPEPGASRRINCDTGFGSATPVTGTFGFAAAAEAIRVIVGPADESWSEGFSP
jgi:tRNA threonylcarbamoyladenosine dehydratase